MKISKLNTVIILGLIATIGILIAQLLWTKQAFTLEEKKFSQKTHIALLEVVKHLYEGTNHEMPIENPIKKIANDYYVVNIDNDFNAEILEFYLIQEFKKNNLNTDFEYAMYNCQSDEMVYGNLVSFTKNNIGKKSVYFPKQKNLVYYFAIRFPNQTTYLFSSLLFWFVLSFALLVILMVYVYSIYTILEQKKYSELQRDFINNMTHEFKTPLSSILIASNFMKQHKNIKKDEKLEKYNQIIINQSNKLNNHIEKILDIAKSDTIPMTIDLKKIDLIIIFNEILDNLKLKYDELDITINSNKKIVTVIADEFHLTNIIYNILENAIKYNSNEPKINIEIVESEDCIILKFIDNGFGIPEKIQQFVFNKFYRIINDKNKQIKGFGLGLYYVKKVCNLHKWKFLIENNPTEGITFSIIIKQR